jgi:hypothetical protein
MVDLYIKAGVIRLGDDGRLFLTRLSYDELNGLEVVPDEHIDPFVEI